MAPFQDIAILSFQTSTDSAKKSLLLNFTHRGGGGRNVFIVEMVWKKLVMSHSDLVQTRYRLYSCRGFPADVLMNGARVYWWMGFCPYQMWVTVLVPILWNVIAANKKIIKLFWFTWFWQLLLVKIKFWMPIALVSLMPSRALYLLGSPLKTHISYPIKHDLGCME